MHTNQWLALETSTDTLSLAVARGTQTWTHTSAGGALTSTHMIPQTLALLKEAGLALTDLQAVVFGRGPGAFTGLRTACSVAQGLAFGADLPVLPIDTLLAVAEEARAANALIGGSPVTRVLAVMDARMEQVYVAAYEFTPNVAGLAGEATQMVLGAACKRLSCTAPSLCIGPPIGRKTTSSRLATHGPCMQAVCPLR
jgi:tRNA threonylcarbamoyladenosine biosynthesis protein TsaB